MKQKFYNRHDSACTHRKLEHQTAHARNECKFYCNSQLQTQNDALPRAEPTVLVKVDAHGDW